MPRRHPKPEEKKGKDPARERERREKRKARRIAKSPGNYTGGILTKEEVELLKGELRVVENGLRKDPDSKRLKMHKRNLRSELRQHEESLKKKDPVI
jgi:hypothetical protein